MRHRRSGILSRTLVLCVRAYQRLVAPSLPPSCRFEPSCSAYMIEALRTHGAVKGVLLGTWRITRCNPWCNGGWDPVPEPKERRTDDAAGADCS